jgi:hypothetical protein
MARFFAFRGPSEEEMGYVDMGCVYLLLPHAGPWERLVTAFPVWVGFAALIPVLLMVLACGAREISFRRTALPGAFRVAVLSGFGVFVATAAASILASFWKTEARADTHIATTVDERKERGSI